MRVLLPTIPDPVGVLVANEQTTFVTPPIALENPCFQGPCVDMQWRMDRNAAVPMQYVNWHPLWGQPSQVGPMVVGGGVLVWQQIGKPPLNPFVDPVQMWLNSKVVLDNTGALSALYVNMLPNVDDVDWFLFSQPLSEPDFPTLPTAAEDMSGLLDTPTYCNPPPNTFPTLDDYSEATVKWVLAGQTKTLAGAAVANVRVVAMRVDKIAWNPDAQSNPIVGETVSNASGMFSIQVATTLPHQLFGYVTGSPDNKGITINTLVPSNA